MKIKGTEYESFKLLLTMRFKDRDVLNSFEDVSVVVEDSIPYGDDFEHSVYAVLAGDELEMAIGHFRFLNKYNEFLTL